MSRRVRDCHSIDVSQRPGTCRWCQCTDDRACPGGCLWANVEATLCSACVPFDRAVRTPRRRAELAAFLRTHKFWSAPDGPFDARPTRRLPKCARRGCSELRASSRHKLCRIHSQNA